MRLFIFSDIHSDLKALERAIATDADYYFVAGDLVSWARGLDKAGEILKPKADRVFVIPGNHESPADIAAFCAQYGFTDFHGQSRLFGEKWYVAGLGCSSPTPFNTPGEYSEAEFARRLAPFAALQPLILVCHCPPRNTRLDRAAAGQHFGSAAIGEFIAAHQPRYFFCGHIHEAEGVTEQLNEATTGVNVGKPGFLLDLATL